MKSKKVPSPTGRPSQVNPSLGDAMKGKGGSRKSSYTMTGKVKDDTNYIAEKMDKGLPLSASEEKRWKELQRNGMKTNY